MISANQILEVALNYLLDSDKDKFALNFARLSHNIHANGDAEAIILANEIECKVAALGDGMISLPFFRDFLRELIIAKFYVVSSTVSAPTAAPLSQFISPYLAPALAGSAAPLVAHKQPA